MKSKKLKFLETALRLMAKVVLKKYKPTIIGITGSVGKTSTKEAVFAVLSKKTEVRKNEKNYNNEIGIPLTILGSESGGRSIFKWMNVVFRWILQVILPLEYPKVLILEMGVDRPGDMEYLLSFVKPSIGIVTNVSSSHIEYFKSIDKIAKEKGRLVEILKENGTAILNMDDSRVAAMLNRTKAQALTFGFDQDAAVAASNVQYNYEDGRPEGLSFKLSYDGKTVPVRLRFVLASHHIYAVLAGVCAGIAMKMNLVDIATSLENLTPLPGRLNLIEGIKGSFLIDDTYNASPVSAIAALNVLGEIEAPRKIAVLGDMLELGEETELGHREVARKANEIGADIFVGVGKRMEWAIEELRSLGYGSEKLLHFESPEDAGRALQDLMEKGDLVLVKGSQGMRMEKIMEELMQNPLDAEKLLCRQNPDWKSRPFQAP